MLAREGDGGADLLQHLGSRELQLRLPMDRAGTEEDMDTLAPRVGQRRARGANIPVGRPRERADDRPLDLLGDPDDRARVAGRGRSEENTSELQSLMTS